MVSVMETNSVLCEVGIELVLLKRASLSEERADEIYKPCEKVDAFSAFRMNCVSFLLRIFFLTHNSTALLFYFSLI